MEGAHSSKTSANFCQITKRNISDEYYLFLFQSNLKRATRWQMDCQSKFSDISAREDRYNWLWYFTKFVHYHDIKYVYCHIYSLKDEKPESNFVWLLPRPSIPPSFITVVPKLRSKPKSGLWGVRFTVARGSYGELDN